MAYVGLFLIWPLLLWGFPYPTHDGGLHERWLQNFLAQLRAGDVYPRWLMNMNGGLGSPVFFFYPPVPYFLTALPGLLCPQSADAWRLLGFGAAMALVASGLTAYQWLSSWSTSKAALIGAVFYMAAPYHLAADLYRRGAYAELWAFVWLPCLLHAAGKVAERQAWGRGPLAVGYALLWMTHPPAALIFSLLPLAWTFWRADRANRWHALGQGAGSLLLGLALASVYLVPALTSQDDVQMEVMHSGSMHFRQNFLLQTNMSAFSRELCPMLVALGLIGWGAGWAACQGARKEKRLVWFWLAVLGLSWVMMTPLADKIYAMVPPLQRIQFPWRFGVLLVLCDAVLIALAAKRLEQKCRPWVVRLATGLLFLAAAFFSASPVLSSAFQPRPREPLFMTDRQLAAAGAPEYVPVWAGNRDRRASSDRVVRIPAGTQVLLWAPRRMVLAGVIPAGTVLEMERFYYPGWRARSGRGEELEVAPSPKEGYLQVTVPSGVDRIELWLDKSELEQLGERISWTGLGIWVGGWGLGWRRKRQKTERWTDR